MQSTRNSPYKLDFLLALRGLLALAVVVHHYDIGPYLSAYFNSKWFLYISPDGSYAVFGFFILSGFLMAKILHTKYDYPRGTRHFYLNRLTRIVPIYYFALIVTFLVALSEARERAWMTDPFNISSLLFFFNNYNYSISNPPLWSISAEVQFYILAPFFAWWTRKADWRKLSLFFVVLFLISMGARLIYLGKTPQTFTTYSNFEVNLIFFAVGWLAYHIRERLPQVGSKAALAILLLTVLICWIVDLNYLPRGFSEKIGDPVYFIYLPLLCAFSYLVLLPSLDRSLDIDSSKHFIMRLSRGLLFFFGITSFSSYVLHFPFSNILFEILPSGYFNPLLALVLLYIACYIVYLVIEKPLFLLRVKIKTR